MHSIYYKTYSPCIYKHYKRITNIFNCIQPYNKYNYMNNYLMAYGPRLWNELIIDNKKLVYISLFGNIIFNYFVTL